MKECRITDRWTLGGLKTIIIENELLRLSVLVDLGARIHEFVYKPFDRDFFWHNPRIEPRTPVFQADIDAWLSGGMDEAIPTGHPSTYRNEVYPYLGEVWSLRWDYEILQRGPEAVEVHLWRYAPISPLRVDRWMLLRRDEPVLHMRHRVTNLSSETFDFLWGLHPCWDVSSYNTLRPPRRRDADRGIQLPTIALVRRARVTSGPMPRKQPPVVRWMCARCRRPIPGWASSNSLASLQPAGWRSPTPKCASAQAWYSLTRFSKQPGYGPAPATGAVTTSARWKPGRATRRSCTTLSIMACATLCRAARYWIVKPPWWLIKALGASATSAWMEPSKNNDESNILICLVSIGELGKGSVSDRFLVIWVAAKPPYTSLKKSRNSVNQNKRLVICQGRHSSKRKVRERKHGQAESHLLQMHLNKASHRDEGISQVGQPGCREDCS